MNYIALILAVFMLAAPVVSYGKSSEATPSRDGGAKAGQETIRSGITGQAVQEKEQSAEEKEKQHEKKAKHRKGTKGKDQKLRGLDRADEVAGEHGQQGRDNARSKQAR